MAPDLEVGWRRGTERAPHTEQQPRNPEHCSHERRASRSGRFLAGYHFFSGIYFFLGGGFESSASVALGSFSLGATGLLRALLGF